MNKKIIIIICIAVLIGLTSYLTYKSSLRTVNLTPTTQPNSACLGSDEIASQNTAAGHNGIVVRNKNTNVEVRRFSLPQDVIFVGNFETCSVYIVVATAYHPNTASDGINGSLEPGGTLELWRYSYDERGVKVITIVSDEKLPVFINIDKLGKYVATSETGDITDIKIFDLATGSLLLRTTPTIQGGFWAVNWYELGGKEFLDVQSRGNNNTQYSRTFDTTTWTETSR